MLGLFALEIQAADVARIEDARFELRIFAQQPDIWTPTGIAVDKAGRIFMIESNTHLPKPDYDGPKSDQVKMFVEKDGKVASSSVFAEGFRWAMNLAFATNGDLFLVQRDAVMILRDRDGDGKADAPEKILRLETKGDYPHNGLDGLTIARDGWVYVGMGENLGMNFTLTGKDASISGDQGGHIFRCRMDGSKLERFATGFWNPFSMTFDDAGNLFAVDNDPDGRPPCRLVHVMRGGNYGYQFRYGRSGLHPFQAWDGELPGTLPMVAGTGEAPSGIVWCARMGWPEEYSNSLLGTSWGDNLIETFPLRPLGASFKSERKILARGDQSFRPVALAAAPDGTVYISDWGDKEYSVHKKGRIWRLTQREPFHQSTATPNPQTARLSEIAQVTAKSATPAKAVEALLQQAASEDRFIQRAAINELTTIHSEALLAKRMAPDPKARLAILLALREQDFRSPIGILKRFLQDDDESIRQMAMIWTAEKGLNELKPDLLAAVLQKPQSLLLLQTYLAAEQILGGYKKNSVWEQGSSGADLVAALLKDEARPESLRALANHLKGAAQKRPIPGAPVAEPAKRPQTEGEWIAAIGFGGDSDTGQKLFFSDKIGCAKCHRVQGDGGNVGPDLGVIARSSDRAKLVNSVLQPSANIGPLYVTHIVTTKDGDQYTGLVPGKQAPGKVTVIPVDGKPVEIASEKIASDRVSELSLMPAGLEAGLTVREFADLISFLETLK